MTHTVIHCLADEICEKEENSDHASPPEIVVDTQTAEFGRHVEDRLQKSEDRGGFLIVIFNVLVLYEEKKP